MVFVLTADQRGSRSGPDRVPEVLALAEPVGMVRSFERTAGDEVQAVFDSAAPIARLAIDLTASGQWSIGIGIGAVDEPLPPQTRAGRGPAFIAARDAVEAAKKNRWHLCVAGQSPWCMHAQTAGRLLLDVLTDRSDAGREAVALVADGGSQAAAARQLEITPQAMSLRLQHARWDVEPGARDLFTQLLDAADRNA